LTINEGDPLRDNYKLVFLVLISFSVIYLGLACGDNSIDAKLVYHLDQNVNGNGFFSTYRDTNVANLNISNAAHGSGSYSYESNIDAQNEAKYQRGGEVEDRIIVFDDSWNSWSMAKINESTDFSYAPIDMQLGKYSRPIAFKSKGKDATCLKNYNSGVSIDTRFNYAEMLHNNLTAELLWSWKRIDDELEIATDNQTKIKLKLIADFSGNGHFGVLNTNRGRQDPNILIDEDYSGTYSITKSISHVIEYKRKQQSDEWLPCCSSGFADMNYMDQVQYKSAKGIFDCTCSVQPRTI
jgi:hypothetical protein